MIPQSPQMNQNMAMFAQMAGQPQGGGQPQMQPPPQMPPQMPQQMLQLPAPAQTPPGGAPMGSPTMQAPLAAQGGQPASRFTPQELAGLGRYGDTLVAHLTPGEITVPKPLQTPKVLATIKKAAEAKGADPQKLIAGSPESSINPQTGVAEYNFMSAFLPAALGLAGSMIVPGLGMALSPMLAGAIGAGGGTALGGLLSGQSPLQAGLSGLGAGAGGYMLGNLFNPASSTATGATGAAAQGAAQSANQAGLAAPTLSSFNNIPGALNSSFEGLPGAVAAPPASNFSNLWGNLPKGMSLNAPSMIGSTVGGQIGSALGAPAPITSAPKPSGFNDHMTPVDQLPSWQDQLGQNSYKGPYAQYNGFDPMSSDPSKSTGYNFYPVPMPQIPRA